jgi:hypothetical protein
MWESLQQRQATESQINVNWLMLLHQTARSIAEYLSTLSASSMMVSAADGTILGRLAALLLCRDVSVLEAGYAQFRAVGIHRELVGSSGK